MKYFTFLLFAFALLTSCKNDKSTLRDTAPNTIPPAATTPPPAAAANVAGGAHYVCTLAGCTGQGAGSAGSCSVCNNPLSHNQAFHNNTSPQVNTANEGLSPLFTTPKTDPNAPAATTPAVTTAEPAQNAAGVWHYTCSNGCAGGGGSAVACASCGTTLAHNTTYHN